METDDTLRLPEASLAQRSWGPPAPPPPASSVRSEPAGAGTSRYVPFATALLMAVLIFTCAPFVLPTSSSAVPSGEVDAAADGGIDAGPPRPALAAGFAILIVLVGVRWSAFFVFAFFAHRQSLRRLPPEPHDLPLVSILVPAYNEGETIEAALRSLVQLDYPRYEVIVVDDGSKDGTYAKAKPFAGDYGRCTVHVHRKPNGGKWSALNFAFHRSVGELVLCVDADSRLDPGSLRHMVAHMADPLVASVAGQVRVRNRENLITRLQGLEYVIANGLIRMAQGLTGSVLVVPGPIGLFRRTALEEVFVRFGSAAHADGPGEVDGPFEGDTFAEDFDLSLSLLALGGKCAYEPRAVSHTKAPDWSFRLLNQRYRWCRGTIQVLRKYARRCRTQPDLLRPRLLCWLGVTYALELLVLPLVNLTALALLVAVLAGGGSLLPLAGWVAAFTLLNLNAAAFFIAVHGDRLRTLAVLPLYDLYHAVLLNCGLAIAVVDELRGRSMRW